MHEDTNDGWVLLTKPDNRMNALPDISYHPATKTNPPTISIRLEVAKAAGIIPGDRLSIMANGSRTRFRLMRSNQGQSWKFETYNAKNRGRVNPRVKDSPFPNERSYGVDIAVPEVGQLEFTLKAIES